MVINIVKQFTGEEPMRSFIQDANKVMARPGMLSASVAEGYPYSDVEQMGMGFLAISDGDPVAARDGARWMAERAWARREELVEDVPSPEEALRTAVAEDHGPVVLMDVGDNVGGGSSADSTVLLAEARRQGIGDYLADALRPRVGGRLRRGRGRVRDHSQGRRQDGRHARLSG